VPVIELIYSLAKLTMTARTLQAVWSLGYGLNNLGFKSQQQQEIFIISVMSRPVLAPTQPPIQRVPEFFPGGKTAVT
jgi:hypothetical protein